MGTGWGKYSLYTPIFIRSRGREYFSEGGEGGKKKTSQYSVFDKIAAFHEKGAFVLALTRVLI
jgi:hypothetical protein